MDGCSDLFSNKGNQTMSIVIAALVSMGARILTAKVIEAAVISLAEVLVKRTASKVDDRLLNTIKESLKGK